MFSSICAWVNGRVNNRETPWCSLWRYCNLVHVMDWLARRLKTNSVKLKYKFFKKIHSKSENVCQILSKNVDITTLNAFKTAIYCGIFNLFSIFSESYYWPDLLDLQVQEKCLKSARLPPMLVNPDSKLPTCSHFDVQVQLYEYYDPRLSPPYFINVKLPYLFCSGINHR